MTLPRIALVTPVFNSAKYIEQAIQSVLAQHYPNLEYFIIDGGSTDGTLDIIRKYEGQISGWVSEPDTGMYDAINKGFARTTGEIMGWISATDMLHVGGLSVVGSVFRSFPEVEWIEGLHSVFSEVGMAIILERPRHWSRHRFLAGANHFIMQESTYWRRTLWEKAGGHVDASQRNGSDFELWIRFFRHARLYPVNSLIGGYRHHPDALGVVAVDEWEGTHDRAIESELDNMPWGKMLRLFRAFDSRMRKIRGLRYFWRRLVEPALYSCPGPDWAPIIQYTADRGWVYRR
jgi:glycosyltransferase involved in cell wall biosynthesis